MIDLEKRFQGILKSAKLIPYILNPYNRPSSVSEESDDSLNIFHCITFIPAPANKARELRNVIKEYSYRLTFNLHS